VATGIGCSNIYLYNKNIDWLSLDVFKAFWALCDNICECVYCYNCYHDMVIICC
jgi:hypothetical protein